MFTISSEDGPGYLRIVVAGPAGVDETCAGAMFCAELLRRKSPQRVLLDMQAFVPSFARADGLEILSSLYAGMPLLERLAIVKPAGGSHGLVIDVARHRNVAAQEFGDRAGAEDWLSGEPVKR